MLSTFLDPRFKNIKFLDDEKRKSVEGKVIDLAKITESYVSIDDDCPAQLRAKKSALDELLGETEEDDPDDGQGSVQEESKR